MKVTRLVAVLLGFFVVLMISASALAQSAPHGPILLKGAPMGAVKFDHNHPRQGRRQMRCLPSCIEAGEAAEVPAGGLLRLSHQAAHPSRHHQPAGSVSQPRGDRRTLHRLSQKTKRQREGDSGEVR